MPISLKYAVVERERRYLLASIPEGVTATKQIIDRYVTGTRLRLRQVHKDDGTAIRKLGHKVRLTDGPAEVACTNLYLDERERAALHDLPARMLRKKRHLVHRDGWALAVDEHEYRTLIAEIEDEEVASRHTPPWLEVVKDMSDDERWTGARLADQTP